MAPLTGVNYQPTSTIPSSDPDEPQHAPNSGNTAPAARPPARQRTANNQQVKGVGQNQLDEKSEQPEATDPNVSHEDAIRMMVSDYGDAISRGDSGGGGADPTPSGSSELPQETPQHTVTSTAAERVAPEDSESPVKVEQEFSGKLTAALGKGRSEHMELFNFAGKYKLEGHEDGLSKSDAQELLKKLDTDSEIGKQFEQLSDSSKKELRDTLTNTAKGYTTKFEGVNELNKSDKVSDAYSDNNFASSSRGAAAGTSSAVDPVNNQLGIGTPDHDNGQQLYKKTVSQIQVEKKTETETKHGTLTSEINVATNQKTIRGEWNIGGTGALQNQLQVGRPESQEWDKTQLKVAVGGEVAIGHTASLEQSATKTLGDVSGTAKVKISGNMGASASGEIQAQAGGNLANTGLSATGQAVAGFQGSVEAKVELSLKTTSTGPDDKVAEETVKVAKLQVQLDATVAAQANANVTIGNLQTGGGAGVSADLMVGGRVVGKISGELAGIGSSAQFEAIAGVGFSFKLGATRDENGVFTFTHGASAAAGAGFGYTHQFTFNPVATRESVRAVAQKIPAVGRKMTSVAGDLLKPGKVSPKRRTLQAKVTNAPSPTGARTSADSAAPVSTASAAEASSLTPATAATS